MLCLQSSKTCQRRFSRLCVCRRALFCLFECVMFLCWCAFLAIGPKITLGWISRGKSGLFFIITSLCGSSTNDCDWLMSGDWLCDCCVCALKILSCRCVDVLMRSWVCWCVNVNPRADGRKSWTPIPSGTSRAGKFWTSRSSTSHRKNMEILFSRNLWEVSPNLKANFWNTHGPVLTVDVFPLWCPADSSREIRWKV